MRNAAFSLGRIFAWLGLLAFVLFPFGLLSEFYAGTAGNPPPHSSRSWNFLCMAMGIVSHRPLYCGIRHRPPLDAGHRAA